MILIDSKKGYIQGTAHVIETFQQRRHGRVFRESATGRLAVNHNLYLLMWAGHSTAGGTDVVAALN